MAILAVQNLKKSFGSTEVLTGIDFFLEKGEVLAIIGSSGSGKTTLLRCLNFLETPTEGRILLDGQTLFDADDPATQRERDIRQKRLHFGLVFQSFNLFPQYTALQNVMLAPELQARTRPDYRTNRAAIQKELERHALQRLEEVGLSDKAGLYPHQLSGGQQQRVAIARALVNRPKVLLLDEPLGALDLRLRKDMQNELKRIQQQLGITFIYVTHDQEEALAMSDTVVVMDKGRIQQIGTPEDIYNEPKNAFVADFIGESNILDGIMRSDYVVEFFGRKFRCLDKGFAPDEPVDVVIRPEDVDIVPADSGHLCGTVTSVTFKGVHYDTIVDFRGFKWLIQTTELHQPGEYIGIKLTPDDIHVMKKSEYSGMFGDYSSYSAEYDEINDPDAVIGGEETVEEALNNEE